MSANKTYTFTIRPSNPLEKQEAEKQFIGQETDGNVQKYFREEKNMSVEWARRYGGYEIECICEQTKERVDY